MPVFSFRIHATTYLASWTVFETLQGLGSWASPPPPEAGSTNLSSIAIRQGQIRSSQRAIAEHIKLSAEAALT